MAKDLLDRLNMDNEAVAAALARDVATLLNEGSDRTAMVRKLAQESPEDATTWFDLGVCTMEDSEMLGFLLTEKYRMEHPGMAPDEAAPIDYREAKRPLHERALRCFERVLELEPEYYGVQHQRGLVYADMGDAAAAERCLLQALEDDPENFSSAQDLAMLYHDLGNTEESERYEEMAQRIQNEGE